MRLLLIQEYAPRSREIKLALVRAGHSVLWVADAGAGKQALRQGVFDVVLAESNWRHQDDDAFPGWFRSEGCRGALVLFVDREDLPDRLLTFAEQVDDFVVTPVDPTELGARLLALGRRGVFSRGDLIEYGPLVVDVTAHWATLHGEPVRMAPRELRLLTCLLQNRGTVCDLKMLRFAMSRDDRRETCNVVAGYIHTLRRRLPDIPIRTIKGVGYTIDTLEEELSVMSADLA